LATPQKRKKSGIDQILASVYCPRENENTDIKKVAGIYEKIIHLCKTTTCPSSSSFNPMYGVQQTSQVFLHFKPHRNV